MSSIAHLLIFAFNPDSDPPRYEADANPDDSTATFVDPDPVTALNEAFQSSELKDRLGHLLVIDTGRAVAEVDVLEGLADRIRALPDSKGTELAKELFEALAATAGSLHAARLVSAPGMTTRQAEAAHPQAIVVAPYPADQGGTPQKFDVWGPHEGALGGQTIEACVESVRANLYKIADTPVPRSRDAELVDQLLGTIQGVERLCAEHGDHRDDVPADVRVGTVLASLKAQAGAVTSTSAAEMPPHDIVVYSAAPGEGQKHAFDVYGLHEHIKDASPEAVVRCVRHNLQAITGRSVAE